VLKKNNKMEEIEIERIIEENEVPYIVKIT
jgi:hypothetical protein